MGQVISIMICDPPDAPDPAAKTKIPGHERGNAPGTAAQQSQNCAAGHDYFFRFSCCLQDIFASIFVLYFFFIYVRINCASCYEACGAR